MAPTGKQRLKVDKAVGEPGGLRSFLRSKKRSRACKRCTKKEVIMELPQYTLKPNVNRMLVPWILKLLGLAALFYGGIYANVRFMFNARIPAFINLFIFVFLIVLVGAQVVLYHVRFGRFSYLFYTNRIEFKGKKSRTFLFDEFSQAEIKQGVFDKMFNTGIIRLSKDFSVGPISNVSQIKEYLEQLVRYHVASQQRFRQGQQQASMKAELSSQGAASQAAARSGNVK
jgi:hypothetical protein